MQPYIVGKRPERIDRIARTIYGSERNGALEQLLAANPGVAAVGAFIPAGTVLQVPDPPASPTSTTYVLPWQ